MNAKCDVCGAEIPPEETRAGGVREEFRTESISLLCPGCMKTVNEFFHKACRALQDISIKVQESWVRRLLNTFRTRKGKGK